MQSNSTVADTSSTVNLTSFDSNGFSVGDGGTTNQNNQTYVGWAWLAGTAFSNDSSATGVGSIDSEGQVNTEAGFAIIKYTGTNSSSETIAHGLGKVPDMIMIKQRDSSSNFWCVYHSQNTSAPETELLRLNTTNATLDGSVYWNDTAPTSSVFTVGTSSAVNASGNYIAYLFNGVEGYSKFGSYTGNGSSDGPYVHTGFRPSFIMIKPSSHTGNWRIMDTKREVVNDGESSQLFPNLADAESTGTATDKDILSNGFKIRTSTTSMNTNNGAYIYMAFAEMPFKYANAR